MAGCKMKDFNELVPDMLKGISNDKDREHVRMYMHFIIRRLFHGVYDIPNIELKKNRVFYRSRVLKNVVQKADLI